MRGILLSCSLLCAALLASAAPSLSWMDTGELTTATFTLGVGHPPGEPVYLQLGFLSTRLPLASLPFRLTVLSALCTLLCLPLLARALRVLFRLGARTEQQQPLPSWTWLAVAGMLLALPIWLQSVRVELYSLQLLLSLGALCEGLVLARARAEGSAPGLPDPRPVYRMGLWVGLGMAVHPLLMGLQLPGLLLLLGWPGMRTLATAALAGMLGASSILFLPLRSGAEAGFSWGQPHTLPAFLDHVLARGYTRSFVHTTQSHFWENLWQHGALALQSFGVLLLTLAGVGLWYLRGRPRVLLSLVLLGLFNPLGTLTQSLFDPDNPDALGYLALGASLIGLLAVLGLASGLETLQRWLERFPQVRPRVIRLGLLALVMGVAAVPGLRGVVQADHHDRTLHTRYAQRLMSELPPGATLVTAADASTLSAWYAKAVEGRRPDVWVLSAYLPPRLSPLRQPIPPDLPVDDAAPETWPGQRMRRVLDWRVRQVPVHLNALDLPLARAEWLRPASMTFRWHPPPPSDMPGDAIPPAALESLDHTLPEIERFWQAECDRLRADPGWTHDRASRLYYPAHLEAIGDWLAEVGLPEQAIRIWRLLEEVDPDAHRLVRLKRHTLQQALESLVPPPSAQPLEQALVLVQRGQGQAAQALLEQWRGARAARPKPGAPLGPALLTPQNPAGQAEAGELARAAALEARLRRVQGDVRGVATALLPCIPLAEELSCAHALIALGGLVPYAGPDDPLQQVLLRLGQTQLEALGTVLERLRLAGDLDTAKRIRVGTERPDISVRLEVELGWLAIAEGALERALWHLRRAEARTQVAPEVLRLAGYLHRQGVR